MNNFLLLYPELQKYDGLPQTLRNELSLFDKTLKISGRSFSQLIEFMEYRDDGDFWHLSTKVVSKNDRWVDINLAVEQRLFILNLGEGENIEKIYIETDDFSKSIHLIRAWLIDQVNVTQLKAIPNNIFLLDLDNDSQYIQSQWIRKHRRALNDGIFIKLLAPIFAVAGQDPILSQLTPYTSHDALFLSRYIDYPFSNSELLPMCHCLLGISMYKSFKHIIKNKDLARAEDCLKKELPESGLNFYMSRDKYELIDEHQQIVGAGNAIDILDLIVEYTYKRFVVWGGKIDKDGNRNKIGIGSVEFANNSMRDAIPENIGQATWQRRR